MMELPGSLFVGNLPEVIDFWKSKVIPLIKKGLGKL